MSDKKEKSSKKPSLPPKKDMRQLLWYVVVALTLTLIITSFLNEPQGPGQITYSQFKQQLGAGDFQEVTIKTSDKVIVGKRKTGELVKSFYVDSPTFISEIESQGVSINVNPAESNWFLSLFLQAFLPFILIGVLWFVIFRQAQGANNQALSFGKSRANASKKGEKQNKTFKDVAGADEAVEELKEIVDFLKHPKRYLDIGAKIPKGALLMGPPGTGKTLLAKAIAGEADVPFFSLSGSEFVEMFVGVGASRVRDLFGKAKKEQPAIIFVDELDAVGRHRGAGLGGGHDEREQTLNQLLVEMDGFDEKHTVIILAATNRPDILDPALLRPGRFDRQIVVDKPDIKGRLDILKIHAGGKKFKKDINLEIVAKRTPGFTGADLENLLNESALLAAREKKKQIAMEDLESATDKVMAGPERKSKLMPLKEKEIIAYHEVGHAIVAYACENADPVHKISILPRGMALGYTLQLPVEDKYLQSRHDMINLIRILMGGRIAEDMIFSEITTGASNDIERATDIARSYVCNYGMSKKLGTRKYGKSQGQVFLGRDYSDHSKDYSEKTAQRIDEEIQDIIQSAYNDAEIILKKHKKKLIDISKVIMEKEVLDSTEFESLMKKAIKAKPKTSKKKAGGTTKEVK